MYYWQSDAPNKFISQGNWDRERERYGSYDGKIKPNIPPKIKVDKKAKDINPRFIASKNRTRNQKALNLEIGCGIRQEVITRRLEAGWTQEDALNKPLMPRTNNVRNLYIGCKKFTFVEFARHIGVTYTQLNYKFRRDRITKTHWQEAEVAHLIEQWYQKFDSI